MFKTILMHVDDSPLLESRLQAAAWLADAHDAHLVGGAATGISWPAFVMLDGAIPVAPAEEYESLRRLARERLDSFTERARRLGVASLEGRVIDDEPRAALLLQSRYADLVVASQDTDEGSPVRGLPQYLAMHGPRPVLVVPPRYRGEPIANTVLVAWDGSVQAIRAIDAALPVLVRASAVRLALVNPDHEPGLHGDEPGADMALYLARHGVRVEVVVEQTLAPVGNALLDMAFAAGAGLLVAGAYGHSRFRELALGGVTRVLLAQAALPVLFAH